MDQTIPWKLLIDELKDTAKTIEETFNGVQGSNVNSWQISHDQNRIITPKLYNRENSS